ncbi:MAG: DUF1854 domain-containing protein [Eubacteriales bacterium]
METKEKNSVKAAENNKSEVKKENKAETKKAENKAEEKKADSEDSESEEVNADDLFKHRESINLTPENAWFSLSAGGLISLKIINAEGNEEFFERVVIRRSFPVTAPDEFLSVREPDSRIKGRGAEIGMIRNINIFDKDTVKLINDELEVRYFTPEIKKITSAKEKFGYTYWEADTTAGSASIVLNNPFSNIRVLEDKRIFISDMDGNCFVIPDPSKLDKLSYKYIEIYI